MTSASQRLRFDLRPHHLTSRLTTCSLSILIDRQTVWPVRDEDGARIEIQIDDLLAHLTEFWKPLMLRQVYPIDVNPTRPSDLRAAAEKRWDELQPEVVTTEDATVSNFEEAHDLANAFAGTFGLPPFWLMRSGTEYIIEASKSVWHLPFEDVSASLSGTGDWICRRLVAADADRWRDAIAAWNERFEGDAAGLLAWSAGIDRALAIELLSDRTLDPPQDFKDAVEDNDELRIAARMAGALPPDQVRAIIILAKQFPARDAANLQEAADACTAVIAARCQRVAPFVQGEAAARFVREYLGIPSGKAVSVFEIAATLGVELRHEPTEPPSLDGLAIWGHRHGPGVFLNEASRRILGRDETDVEASLGARVTLAHELCHLLLDGRHALSAVEVLKARMPAGVEQRARSFAGEFLLPTEAAAALWHEAARPSHRLALADLVLQLIRIYQVTRSVAAWKVEHAARRDNVDLSAALDSVAPHR